MLIRNRNKKIKKIGFIFFFALFVFCLVAVIPRFEGGKPDISIDLCSNNDYNHAVIGTQCDLLVSLSDKKTGIRNLKVLLQKNGRDILLLEERFNGSSFFLDKNIYKKDFNIIIEPKKLNLQDGTIKLKIIASDFSLRKNNNIFEKELKIDTKSPNIEILSKAHNIKIGGSALIIYKLSEDCKKSGVKVENNFFQGYSGNFADKNIFMAFFALEHNQSADTQITLEAVDYADNISYASFPKYLGDTKFKHDIIELNDKFFNVIANTLDNKIDEDLKKTSLRNKFIYINHELRKTDYQTINDSCKHTENKILWNKEFLRLPGSAKKAGFGDRRTYKYKGEIIDQQAHMGIDLASVAKAQVPAANSGKIVFTGKLALHGNTVIIDHGFNIFSLYSHLSSIYVKKGAFVSKKDIIGKTGSTGLALGDHLHFSMIVGSVFVNPVEWWDMSWIKNNILTKIAETEN
jgi:murein DD-endopeptidase MepM/ murein hydrolase activator NlpD